MERSEPACGRRLHTLVRPSVRPWREEDCRQQSRTPQRQISRPLLPHAQHTLPTFFAACLATNPRQANQAERSRRRKNARVRHGASLHVRSSGSREPDLQPPPVFVSLACSLTREPVADFLARIRSMSASLKSSPPTIYRAARSKSSSTSTAISINSKTQHLTDCKKKGVTTCGSRSRHRCRPNKCSREIGSSAPVSACVPELRPRCLLPRYATTSAAAPPSSFLKRIERVEITSVEHFRGVTYYVIDVYLRPAATAVGADRVAASSSRIPMRRLRKVAQAMTSPHATPLKSNQGTNNREVETPTAREPDFRVVRRFTSFDELRAQLSAVCRASRSSVEGGSHRRQVCVNCERFRRFLLHGFTHPRAFVKLCASVSLRKKVLTRFMRRAVELAVDSRSSASRGASGDSCVGCQVLPRLVDQFIRRDMSVIEYSEALL